MESMNTKEEKVEVKDPEERADLILRLHGEVMQQLLKHDRFNAFLIANYKIEQKIDHENQAIGFTVTELSQEESMKLVRESIEQLKKNEQLIIAQPEDLKKFPKPKFGTFGKRRGS